MSEAHVDLGAWSTRKGSPDFHHKAFVIARLGRFPYPDIAKMGGLSIGFVQSVAEDIGFSPQPRVNLATGTVDWPSRGSRQPLQEIREWRPSLPPRARKAIQAVCERHGLKVRDLMVTSLGSNRRIFSWARQEAYAELYALGYSLPLIGTWFKRDHSTVIFGRTRHLDRQSSTKSTGQDASPAERTGVES